MAEMTPDVDVQAAIDEALEELRSAQPAPDFLPRLRARLEQDDPRLPRWVVPAAAVFASAVLVFIIGRDARDVPAARPIASVPIQAAASDRIAVRPKADTTLSPATRIAPAARRPARVRRTPPAPEVLVPASERRAVGRLAAALGAGRPEAISLVNSLAGRVDAASIEPAAMTIPPIRIEPVVVSTIPDGSSIPEK